LGPRPVRADVLAESIAPHGFAVSAAQRSIAFTGDSAAAYIEDQFQSHPLWLAGRAVLELSGRGEELRERVLELFEAGNE
jgi:hypothetical protein